VLMPEPKRLFVWKAKDIHMNIGKLVKGALAAVGGILAIVIPIIIYGMQTCDEARVTVSSLSSELENDKTASSQYKRRLSDLKYEQAKLQILWDENREYLRDLELYNKADKYIGMASRAITKMGGRDVDFFERDVPKWKGILKVTGHFRPLLLLH
jgi:hypothetical protein